MAPSEIYLAMFPFGDAPGMKLRPVLVLTNPIGPVPEVLVAYISSAIPSPILSSDLLLDPSDPHQRSTHLKVASVIRLHKLATIHARSLARRLGMLPSRLKPEVSQRLKSLLNL